jgi:hypothetical protein
VDATIFSSFSCTEIEFHVGLENGQRFVGIFFPASHSFQPAAAIQPDPSFRTVPAQLSLFHEIIALLCVIAECSGSHSQPKEELALGG